MTAFLRLLFFWRPRQPSLFAKLMAVHVGNVTLGRVR